MEYVDVQPDTSSAKMVLTVFVIPYFQLTSMEFALLAFKLYFPTTSQVMEDFLVVAIHLSNGIMIFATAPVIQQQFSLSIIKAEQIVYSAL